MENEAISILLADDEMLFRKGVRFILEKEEGFNIVFEAENGSQIIDYLRHNDLPEIIITDLRMPEMNGVEATKIIHKEFPEVKIIALTSYFSKPFILNMIQVGASSYLAKDSSPKEIVKTVKEVYQKGFFYNDDVLRFIHEDLKSSNVTKSIFDETFLTDREKEVLQLICEQYTTSEIAEKLFISPRTVDGHRNNLLLKTESKNVAGLVINAVKNKLITLPF